MAFTGIATRLGQDGKNVGREVPRAFCSLQVGSGTKANGDNEPPVFHFFE